MLEALGSVGKFLLEHLDLIGMLADALEGGTSKEELKKAIKAAQVAAADAQMRAELGE